MSMVVQKEEHGTAGCHEISGGVKERTRYSRMP